MNSLILAISVSLAAASAPPPPSALRQPYDDLVAAYLQQGTVDSALNVVSGWSHPMIKALVQDVANDAKKTKRIEAAAMLHTECALRLFVNRPDESAFHFGLAHTLVLALRQAPVGSSTDSDQFRRAWYRFSSSVFVARAQFDIAQQLIGEGLSGFADDHDLRLLSGIANEVMAYAADDNLGRPSAERSRRSLAQVDILLRRAETAYRRALQDSNGDQEARLRLGWVLFLEGQSSAARDQLESIAQGTHATVRQEYLRHLFLGALDDEDPTAALHEYEAAREIAPQFQTAYIAISGLQERRGDHLQAHEAAIEFWSATRSNAEDPWWDYRLGAVDATALELLRSEIRQ